MKKLFMLFLFVITIVAISLLGCTRSEEETLADFGTMSDTELDAAMGTEGKSALAEQAASVKESGVKIFLKCNIVGSSLVLSRGDWSRSLPRFFCSTQEGNTQRERICAPGGYTSILTRCGEGGCDVVAGKCISLCGNGVIDVDETCYNCAADVACAAAEWRQERVIFGLNYTLRILVSPSNENSLITIAGPSSAESVYVSNDGGENWRKTLGNEEESVNVIVAGSDDTNRAYAGTFIPGTAADSGKLYLSDDFGQRWEELAEFSGGGIRNIHIDRSNSRKIYVFTQPSRPEYEAGVYISNDGGSTWDFHSFEFPSSYRGAIVWAVDQNLDGDLFLGIELDRTDLGSLLYQPPVLRSRDGGMTWENIFPANPWHIYDIEIDDINNIIYFHQEGEQLYISRDNGNTLNELANNQWGFRMTLNKNNPHEIFFGEIALPGCPACDLNGELWITTNGGETFQRVSELGLSIVDITYNVDYTRLYVATYGGGIVVFERIE